MQVGAAQKRRQLKQRLPSLTGRRESAVSFFRRLYFEPLEDRALLAVLTATQSMLPSGNVLWEVSFDAQDAFQLSGVVDLRFQGEIVQQQYSGSIDVNTVVNADAFDGDGGYSAQEDSWFYADPSGVLGQWRDVLPGSEFPGNTTGIAGMGPGSQAAYIWAGSGGGSQINITPVAHIVTLPSSSLQVDGKLFRNAGTFPVSYTFTPVLPDLTVTQVTAPTTAFAGDSFDISYVLHNIGAETALSGGRSKLWLSTDQVLDGGDLLLNEDVVADSLTPDGSVLRPAVPVTLPEGISGNYFILVEADALQETGDISTSNNMAASEGIFVSAAPLPDLVVTNINLTPAFAGFDATVSFQLDNLGAEASVSLWSAIYLSVDPLFGEGDLLLSYDGLFETVLPEGPTFRFASVSLPINAIGSYYVIVVADEFGEVDEADENNNIGVSAPIEIVPPPPVTQSDVATARQNKSVAIDVLANDSDLDGSVDPTTVEITTAPPHGQVVVDALTGVVTYTPNSGFTGEDQFAYRVRDDLGGASLPATVHVTVIPTTVPFGPQQLISAQADSALSVVTADLDGDGDLDVLSVSLSDSKIAWFENLGAGVFGVEQIISADASGAMSVFAADLDGDGYQDVVAGYYLGEIVWFENQGGSFGSKQVINTEAYEPASIFAADLDGDGDLDVLSAAHDANQIAWYENLGGSFGPQQVISNETIYAQTVFAADLDGDGDLDVLSSSNSDGKIAWYENFGGTFGAQQVIDVAFGVKTANAADIDRDGDVDVLVTSSESGASWYENLGGVFGPSQGIAFHSYQAQDAATGDLDGDGDLDVITVYYDGTIEWNENLGGTFSAAQLITTLAAGGWDIQIADLDGDGDLDVLSASRTDDKIAWYENQRIHRTASFPEVRTIETLSEGGTDVLSADINRDGIPDLVVASLVSGSPFLNWYAGNGEGTFGAAVPFGLEAVAAIQELAAGDFNNDGWQDVVIATSDGIYRYLNSAGSLPSFGSSIDSIFATSLAVGDFNRDGALDLAATASSGALWLYFNVGEGAFAEPEQIISFGIGHIIAGDMDRDGDLDLVFARSDQDDIGWLGNVGGAFTSTHSVQTPIAARLELADVDGDGYPDLFAANGQEIVLSRSVAGELELAVTVATGQLFVDLRSGDLDGDGDLDFVAVAEGRNYWFYNDGSGSFSPAVNQPEVAPHSGSIELVDLDRDGRLDVVSLGGGSAIPGNPTDLVWYPNLAAQATLTTTPLDPTLENGQSGVVLAIDLTHGGRPGDSGVELASIGLLLQDSLAAPLTSNQANAVIDRLRVFRDTNNNGIFEPGIDTLVTTTDDLQLVDGKLSIVLPDDDPLTQEFVDGSLDRSFGVDGRVFTDFSSDTDAGYSIAVQADGKILVAGTASNGVDDDFALVRYNADGTLDTSFDGDGKVTTDFAASYDSSRGLVIQSDGKIVLVGSTMDGGFIAYALARYNSDGSLDTTFDGDGKVIANISVDGSAYAVTLQADGKIVVAGSSMSGSDDDFAVARFNSDGSLDTNFDGDGKVTTDPGPNPGFATSVAMQGDGKILVAGLSSPGADGDFVVLRYNSDGTLDGSFDFDGGVYTDFGGDLDGANSLVVQADGKIVVTGFATNGVDSSFALARYRDNGSLDTSFGGTGKIVTDMGAAMDAASSVVIQADGKILVAGYTHDGSPAFGLVRYNTDGTLDTSFGNHGKLITTAGFGNSVALQADGRILVAGETGAGFESDFVVARYNSDGPSARFFVVADLTADATDQGLDAVTFTHLTEAAESATRVEDASADIALQLAGMTNTSSTLTVAATPDPPDLVINDVTLTKYSAVTGEYLSVFYGLQNLGATATFDMSAGVYLSTDAIWDVNDVPLAFESFSTTLSTNQQANNNFTNFRLPYDVVGTHYILVKADALGEVDELDEDNNASPSAVLEIELNIPPLVSHDTITISPQYPVELSVLDNDTDPDGSIDPMTVELIIAPLHGLAVVDPFTGIVTYTPNPGYTGPDSFSYRVRDYSNGLSLPALVSIDVKPFTVPFAARDALSSTVNGANFVTTADLDRDGDLDILYTAVNGELGWIENLGGSFGPKQTIEVSFSSHSVATADLDGDGDLDVLADSFSLDRIAWYENQGDGTFGTAQVITTQANGIYQVATADLDGDGDIDVLSASTNDDKIAWYENLGSGTFGSQQVISTQASGAHSITTGDLDGDGDLDVLSASTFDDKIAWYENLGAGTFGAEQVITLQADGAQYVAVADLDRDGKLDVLSASYSDDKIAWNKNLGGGAFGAQNVITLRAANASSVTTSDLDGDGDLDVLSSSIADQTIAWYENLGSGLFGHQQVLTRDAVGALSVTAADLDGDGDLDVLSASDVDDTIAWYENQLIHRTPHFPEVRTIETLAAGGTDVLSADINRDGIPDLVVVGLDSPFLSWYAGNGDGTFGAAMPFGSDASSVFALVAGDFNRDGWDDIATASISGVQLYLNSNGSLPQFGASIDGIFATSLAVGDFNRDGLLDLAVTEIPFLSGGLFLYLNAGGGLFDAPLTVAASGVDRVTAGDIDRDGDLDLLAIRSATDDIVVFANLDGETFLTAQIIAATTTDAVRLELADADQDGDLDLFEVNGQQLLLRLNQGSGSFAAALELAAGLNFINLRAGDLDADGDMDLVAAATGRAYWFYNQGDGSFSPAMNQPEVDPHSGSIELVDLNRDGRLDVVSLGGGSAAGGATDLVWYPNFAAQALMTYDDLAPSEVAPGQTVPLLAIQAEHGGRSGDNSIELASLELLLEESNGVPLDDVGAAGLFERVFLFRDANGNGQFDSGFDQLVALLDTFVLDAGVLTFSLPDGDPNAQVLLGSPATYFVVAELTSSAGSLGPTTFRISHQAENSVRVEDAAADIALEHVFKSIDSGEFVTVVAPSLNSPPVLTPIDDKEVNEQELLSFQASATDPDLPSDTLTYSLVEAPLGAIIDAETGIFSWTPTEAQQGQFQVTIRVTDNGDPALEDSQTFTITVNEINVAPELQPIPNQSVGEGELLSLQVVATDPDDPVNALIYTLESAPAGAEIDPLTGLFTWTPSEAQAQGIFLIMIRVFDTGSPTLSSSTSFEVTVMETNSPPVLQLINDQQVNEGALLTVQASATDPDDPANTLTYSLDEGAPAGATIDPLTGLFNWTPSESQGPGVYSITIRVTDNGVPALQDSETFEVTVLEVNSAPVLQPIGNQQVSEGAGLSIQASATDPDDPANTLTYSLDEGAPAGATIDPLTGLFSWTPSESQAPGVYSITIRVTDNGVPALQDSETFEVTVLEINSAPVLQPISNQQASEGALLTIQASATDPDDPANALTYSLDEGAPAGATIDPLTGLFSWTPSESQGPGVYSITIRVTDNGVPALQDSETFEVTVLEVNSAPVLPPISNQQVSEGEQLSIQASATEPDDPANALTYSLGEGAPAGATIDPLTGLFSWTPSESQGPGVYPITIRVTDNGVPALQDSETFEVTVLEVNSAPVLQSISNQQVNEGEQLSIQASATDPDDPANALTYSLGEGAPAGAAIDPLTGLFNWTPSESQGPGVYSITIRVTDNGVPALQDSETFDVTVLELNSAPVLQTISNQQANEGALLTIQASATDTDDPANALTYSLGEGAPAGATIDPLTGLFNWTPSEAQGPGVYSITIRVTDNGVPALQDSQTFQVTIVDSTNLAPLVDDIDDMLVVEGEQVSITVVASDPDSPPTALRYSLLSAPAGATINLNAGVIFWSAASDALFRSYEFLVAVSDGEAMSTESFSVAVRPLPKVTAVRASLDASLARIEVDFNRPLEYGASAGAAGADWLANYLLEGSGGDGDFDDGDEFNIPLDVVTYDPVLWRVTIVPENAAFFAADQYRLVIDDRLVDLFGLSLDGEYPGAVLAGASGFPSGNGRPGGDFEFAFTLEDDLATAPQSLQAIVERSLQNTMQRFAVLDADPERTLASTGVIQNLAVSDTRVNAIVISADPNAAQDVSTRAVQYVLGATADQVPLIQLGIDYDAPAGALPQVDATTAALHEAILAELAAVLGKHQGSIGKTLVVLWFDPVDFSVSTSNGRLTYSNQQGVTENSIPGAAIGAVDSFQVVVMPTGGLNDLRVDLTGANQPFRGGAAFYAPGDGNGPLDVVLKTSFQGHLLDQERLSLVFDPSRPAAPGAGGVNGQAVADVSFTRESGGLAQSGNNRAALVPGSSVAILTSVVGANNAADAAQGRASIVSKRGDATRLSPLDRFIRSLRSRGITAERTNEVGEFLDLLQVLVGDWTEEFKSEVLRKLNSDEKPAEQEGASAVPEEQRSQPAASPTATETSHSTNEAKPDAPAAAQPATQQGAAAAPASADAEAAIDSNVATNE